MIFFFFFVAFSGQLENAIWGPATCCMHIQLCHARCHVNFIYHDHAHARPNKTNAARKVEIIIKKNKNKKKQRKKLYKSERNNWIFISVLCVYFRCELQAEAEEGGKQRADFTLLSCSPQSQLKQAYLPPPPLSLHYSLPGPHNIHSHFGLFVYKSTQFLAGSKNFLSQLSKSF